MGTGTGGRTTRGTGTAALGSADPPTGLRLGLKVTTDTSSFNGPGKIVAKGMQTNGLFAADIGSDWYPRGDRDNRWDQADPASASGNSYVGDLLADFCTLNASDVQVLDTGSPINTGE